MSTSTPNLNLTKPAGNERPDVDVINANMDILDAKIGAVGSTSLQAQVNQRQTIIHSVLVLAGQLNAGGSLDYTVDLTSFGFTAEPQVWWQGYDSLALAYITSVDSSSVTIHFQSVVSWSETTKGWLKLTTY